MIHVKNPRKYQEFSIFHTGWLILAVLQVKMHNNLFMLINNISFISVSYITFLFVVLQAQEMTNSRSEKNRQNFLFQLCWMQGRISTVTDVIYIFKELIILVTTATVPFHSQRKFHDGWAILPFPIVIIFSGSYLIFTKYWIN